MVNIGIVGIGFMGMTHYRAVRKVRRGKVRTICTRDPGKLRGDWRGIRGNFGEPGGVEDLSGVRTCNRFEDVLADPEVDLVDLCLPTALHCEAAVQALRAGKHVLIEKPIALNLRDADRAVREAEKAGRLLMVAHVLPFFPEFAALRKVVEEGEYGAPLGGHFKRIISRSSPASLLRNLELRGGPGIDLHIHDTHYIHLLFGAPDRVWASGHLVAGRYAQYLATTYRFGDRPDLCVTCTSGAISQRVLAFTQGFEVYLEKATAIYEFSTLAGKPTLFHPLTLLTGDGKVRKPRMGSGDPTVAFTREIQAAVNAVSTGIEAPELSGQRAADALRLCLKEVESARRGRAVRVR